MVKKKDQLEPLELVPWRVLAIVAHPDDLEYGAAAAVAKWTSEGVEVVYLIASRGEAGIDDMEPEEAALVRSGEQHAAAEVVGVKVVDFLDVHDGIIQESIPLRRAMVRDIRRFRPDIVLLFNHRETWAKGVLNSADHRAVGQAALDAIQDAANRWVFRDVGEPHQVQTALVAGSPEATHGIDVSEFVNAAVKSLAAHKEYLEGLGDHPMADPLFVKKSLQETAKRLPGSKAAVAVEVFNFG
jgi:LmbE family N-acetylglucosaminyl deacetylase